MSYTTDMWNKYLRQVLAMHQQGVPVSEIATILTSDENLVKAVIEKHATANV